MALDIANIIVSKVTGSDGTEKPAASDAFEHESETTGVDLNAGDETISLTAPDRASSMTLHVETSGAAEAVVKFTDADGNVATQRDKDDDAQYEVTSAGDILVTTAPASPYIEIVLKDNSGAANSTTYSVYIR